MIQQHRQQLSQTTIQHMKQRHDQQILNQKKQHIALRKSIAATVIKNGFSQVLKEVKKQ